MPSIIKKRHTSPCIYTTVLLHKRCRSLQLHKPCCSAIIVDWYQSIRATTFFLMALESMSIIHSATHLTTVVSYRRTSSSSSSWGLMRACQLFLLTVYSTSTRPLFSYLDSPQISLCKKKIPCHIKISANAWSTKCWWNKKLIAQFCCTLRDEHFKPS
jgi:hypothetical protein